MTGQRDALLVELGESVLDALDAEARAPAQVWARRTGEAQMREHLILRQAQGVADGTLLAGATRTVVSRYIHFMKNSRLHVVKSQAGTSGDCTPSSV